MKPLNRLQRFFYHRSLFFLTGLVAIYVSFNTSTLLDRLLLVVTGSTVVGVVLKDTWDDKEP